ncbi:MAG: hypothetical protein KM310_07105, partial [Clostridiales bacterium]|nr:hypothetical protein [Clostridiales bacterium]
MKRFLAFGLVVGMILLVLAVGWVWVVALEDPSEVMANPPTKSPIADPQTQSLAGYQQDFEGMLGWFSGDSGTSGAPSPQGSTRKTKETPKNPPSPSSNAPSSKKDTSAPNEVEDEKKTSDTSQIPLGDLYNKAFTQLPKAVQGKYVTVEYGQGQVIPMDVGPEEQSSYAIPVEDFLAMTEDEREKALKDL